MNKQRLLELAGITQLNEADPVDYAHRQAAERTQFQSALFNGERDAAYQMTKQFDWSRDQVADELVDWLEGR